MNLRQEICRTALRPLDRIPRLEHLPKLVLRDVELIAKRGFEATGAHRLSRRERPVRAEHDAVGEHLLVEDVIGPAHLAPPVDPAEALDLRPGGRPHAAATSARCSAAGVSAKRKSQGACSERSVAA